VRPATRRRGRRRRSPPGRRRRRSPPPGRPRRGGCAGGRAAAAPAPATTFYVDRRRIEGKDTRISTTVECRVGRVDDPVAGGGALAPGGHAADPTELVVTIYPKVVSTKRGGSNFRASQGVGTVHVKNNRPESVDLSVSVRVGPEGPTMRAVHNFGSDSILKFAREIDFKAALDRSVDPPRTEVSIQVTEVSVGREAGVAEAAGPTDPVGGDGSEAAAPPPSPAAAAAAAAPGTPPPTPSAREVDGAARPPCIPPSPYQVLESGSIFFGFTIRLADGFSLGLDVVRDDGGRALRVKGVLSDGAIEAWNRQCVSSPAASKAVRAGDAIVRVNDRIDCEGMLAECRHQLLLRLCVVRGDLGPEAAALYAPPTPAFPVVAAAQGEGAPAPSAEAAAVAAVCAVPPGPCGAVAVPAVPVAAPVVHAVPVPGGVWLGVPVEYQHATACGILCADAARHDQPLETREDAPASASSAASAFALRAGAPEFVPFVA